jgi:tetratricopeptide (TPR) repeat protein
MIDSISFCINSNSGSPTALRECLKYLQQQNVPDFEILIYGRGEDQPLVRYIEDTSFSSDDNNRVRNFLCRQATRPYIALVHAHTQLPSDWYSKIKRDNFAEILGTRLTDPQGCRMADWSYSFQMGDRRLILPLDYDEWTPQAFVGSEVILFHKKVWDNVKFDETRTAHEGLIDFCLHAAKLGYRLGISRAQATVKGNTTSATEDNIVASYGESRRIYEEYRSDINKGNHLFDQQKYEEAGRVFEKIVGVHGREPNLLARLGWACQHQGKFKEARTHFQKAFEMDPENQRALTGLGWALSQMGTFEKAQPYFEKATTLIPSCQTAPWLEAARGLAWACYHQQKYEVAIDHFKKIEEEISKVKMDLPVDIYQGLGWTYFHLQNMQNAYDSFKRGLALIGQGQRDLKDNLSDGLQQAAEAGNIKRENSGFFAKLLKRWKEEKAFKG